MSLERRKTLLNLQGRLEDGTEFDNSRSRSEPFEFELGARRSGLQTLKPCVNAHSDGKSCSHSACCRRRRLCCRISSSAAAAPAAGAGMVIAGLDDAVLGMKVGEKKARAVSAPHPSRPPSPPTYPAVIPPSTTTTTLRSLLPSQHQTVTIKPQDAYGPVEDDLIVKLPFADVQGLAVGVRVQLDSGQEATVIAVGEKDVTVDANHELAGLTLTFDVELTAVRVQRTVSLSGHSLKKMELGTVIVRLLSPCHRIDCSALNIRIASLFLEVTDGRPGPCVRECVCSGCRRCAL